MEKEHNQNSENNEIKETVSEDASQTSEVNDNKEDQVKDKSPEEKIIDLALAGPLLGLGSTHLRRIFRIQCGYKSFLFFLQIFRGEALRVGSVGTGCGYSICSWKNAWRH